MCAIEFPLNSKAMWKFQTTPTNLNMIGAFVEILKQQKKIQLPFNCFIFHLQELSDQAEYSRVVPSYDVGIGVASRDRMICSKG